MMTKHEFVAYDQDRIMSGCCLIPFLGFFSLFVGLAFLGLSFVIVPKGHVGFTVTNDCVGTCSVETFPPGIYFKLPWKRHELKIANISPRNLTLGHITGRDKIVKIEYIVQDLFVYVATLITFKTEMAFNAALTDEMKRRIISDPTIRDGTMIDYMTFGLRFGLVSFDAL